MNPHTSKDYDGLLRQAHGPVTRELALDPRHASLKEKSVIR
jgi:hypothetical protein